MKTKLEQFISRNKKRNKHLYLADLVEGHDYVVCPISQARLSMIKDNYITKILEISVDSYPQCQRICEKRKQNIKQGLHQIDVQTGLTRYEIGQQKAQQTLKQVDSTGLSGYDKKGQQTRATHMNKIDQFGRNGYSQIASKAIVKGNLTKAKKGLITDPTVRTEFYRYKAVVTYLTEKLRNKLTIGYVTGLAGIEGAYHIDHKYSILNGYKNKISPLVIGHLQNLEMIPWKENVSKHAKCSVSIEKLLQETGYSKEKSASEFELTMATIHTDLSNGIPVTGIRILEKIYEANIC
jgi:hypothetical protein